MTSNRARHLDLYLVAIGELARVAYSDAKNLPAPHGNAIIARLGSIVDETQSARLSTLPDDNMEGLLRATIDLVESVLVLTTDGTQRHAPQKKTLRSVIKALSDNLP